MSNSHDYEAIRKQLAEFLPKVGTEVLALRTQAETSPDFVRRKEGGDLVTEADFVSEKRIREWITERFPNDAIHGEEMADTGSGEHVWVVDPIDGTDPFVRFKKWFGIAVGLVVENKSKVGAIHFPAEKKTLSAAAGSGAFCNAHPLVIQPGNKRLERALVIAEFGGPWDLDEPKFAMTGRRLNRLFPHVRREECKVRCFTFGFLQLIQGEAGAIFHCGATPYDIAAACCIAEECGMIATGFEGEPLDFQKKVIPIVITKNRELHWGIIEYLSS